MIPSLEKKVRVRFAPSPTGYLHIGGLRTALYCYFFARAQGGRFVLRIEDTDRTRFVADAEDDILESLEWVGLEIDEGPRVGGQYGPYRQSERTALYVDAATRLLESGHAYRAFDTQEEIQAMRDAGGFTYGAAGRMRMTNSLTLPKSDVEQRIAAGEPHVVRLLAPEEGAIEFSDLIKGSVSIPVRQTDDQVLLKSDGMPTYHLANIVDDHAMRITHVIRGEEWLPSVPKHLLMYEALGWTPPRMAHLPLILSPTGGKLSKRSAERQGLATTVRAYRDEGYEPGAIVNFLAMLGWNPGTEREVFSLEDLIGVFSLRRVGTSGAQFSLNKLRWFNQQHLRGMSQDDLLERVRRCAEEYGHDPADSRLEAIVHLVRDRITLAADVFAEYTYLFSDPTEYDPKGVRRRWKADSAHLVEAYADALERADSFDADDTECLLRDLAAEKAVGAGRIIHAVRLAVTGTTFGPGLFDLLATLGPRMCVRRLRRAARVLGA